MQSEDTKRIIRQIAKEEGLSEHTIRIIVLSQFEGTRKIITSGIADKPETFKNIVINAFGAFNIMPKRFKRLKGREEYLKEKRRRYDRKK